MSAGLNSAQSEAVRYLDGPCLVLAGAGSGKTRVITQKIAHLIEAKGFEPRHIAAVTFTNKAAAEMRERVGKLLEGKTLTTPGKEGRKVPVNQLTVCTFHSLGVQILRQEAEHVGLKPQFSIMDSDDCFGMIQEQIGTTDKGLIRKIQTIISLWKNGLVAPEEAMTIAANEDEHQAALVYRNYVATLHAYQAVDFDDLIRLPTELFARNEPVRDRWQNRLRYLLIDEYQDTNACQYELLKLLAGPRAAFTAVGDDDQAIYGWRGATLENLAQLGKDFPKLHVIKLEQNYRSTVRILTAANNVIANNPKLFEKKLWSEHGMGDSITVTPCNDEEHEAESVVFRLSAHKFERRTQFRDYAILYRGNFQARVFEQVLRRERIPYVLSGGQSFFDKAEIKDLCAYLRLIANADDDPAFIRAVTTPRRGIGNTTLEALGAELEALEDRIFEKTGTAAARALIEDLYRLKRRLVMLQQHTAPLVEPLAKLVGGRVPQVCAGMDHYFRDVYDHLLRIVRTIEGRREMLVTAIQVNLGMISLAENEVTKRLGSFAALFAIPTMIAGIYGMNFNNIPELHWRFGFYVCLGVMAAADLFLWRRFRKAGWL